jgi:hypothetical protein
MSGKAVVLIILAICVIAGGGLYYSLQYAYYTTVARNSPAADVVLTQIQTGAVTEVPIKNFTGIDANSSPLRYRACFKMDNALDTLKKAFQTYPDPTPLTAPRHFACFNAEKIDGMLKQHKAVAFLGQANVHYGVDRVVAVDEDGNGYAWNQLNRCGKAVFDGQPAPQGCPPPPENK